MGREDWYRNEHWDADIEAAFRKKLSRSRSSKPQYLRIQACYLAPKFPIVALRLIEEFFETGDQFDVSQAHCERARAYESLGEIGKSLRSYKQALAWEETHPNTISTARYEFPKIVVNHSIFNDYDYALHILETRFGEFDYNFPITGYQWNGCHAIISVHFGRATEAAEFAKRALAAAQQTESSLRYHRTVGLVRDVWDDFYCRIEAIANAEPAGDSQASTVVANSC